MWIKGVGGDEEVGQTHLLYAPTQPNQTMPDDPRYKPIHRSVVDGDWARPNGITPETHTLLPPYSPDMHSVIELTHAHLMLHFQTFINNRVQVQFDTLQPYLDELERLFNTLITHAYVWKLTVRVYKTVLPAIVQAKGAYPDKEDR